MKHKIKSEVNLFYDMTFFVEVNDALPGYDTYGVKPVPVRPGIISCYTVYAIAGDKLVLDAIIISRDNGEFPKIGGCKPFDMLGGKVYERIGMSVDFSGTLSFVGVRGKNKSKNIILTVENGVIVKLTS